ncbi:hypothetical protein MD484_g5562, partial [Candolleomyces efflorescens]
MDRADIQAKLERGEFLFPADRHEQIYNLIAFWLAVRFYLRFVDVHSQFGDYSETELTFLSFWKTGIYAVLFFAAIFLTNRGKSKRNVVSMTFYVSMYIMFVMNTGYTCINIYRFVQAYAKGDTFEQPIYYFRHWAAWDNFSFVVVVTSLILFADALVIYRCFIIWECSYSVVAVPTLLLAASIGINTVTVTSFVRPDLMNWSQVVIFLNLIYPVNLAQNILTTGLIAMKIWKQHLVSRESGLYLASNWNLLTILRIIVESALVYTVQQVVLCVLYFLRHPAQVIIHATLVPSIGIVFVLIAVRTHMVISDTSSNDWPLRSSFMIPGWSDTGDETDSHTARYRPSSTSPVTPSSAQTNFTDLPILPKEDDAELGLRGRSRGLSFLEMLNEDKEMEAKESLSTEMKEKRERPTLDRLNV